MRISSQELFNLNIWIIPSEENPPIKEMIDQFHNRPVDFVGGRS
jgi:hypothetical protein